MSLQFINHIYYAWWFVIFVGMIVETTFKHKFKSLELIIVILLGLVSFGAALYLNFSQYDFIVLKYYHIWFAGFNIALALYCDFVDGSISLKPKKQNVESGTAGDVFAVAFLFLIGMLFLFRLIAYFL